VHHQSRSSRKEAWRVWCSLLRNGVSPATISVVTRYMVATDDRWTRPGGDFIPAAERWLRAADFTDPDLVDRAEAWAHGEGAAAAPAPTTTRPPASRRRRRPAHQQKMTDAAPTEGPNDHRTEEDEDVQA
jgi:hypothetical protein